jgi:hypothetical protein
MSLGCATACATTTSSSRQHEISVPSSKRVLESRLRHAERTLIENSSHRAKFDPEKFIEVLRNLGRDEQADAFVRYVERQAAGMDFSDPSKTPDGENCEMRSLHRKVFRSWNSRPRLMRKMDRTFSPTGATFKIGSEGEIYDIDVYLAQHSAAAWLVIERVGRAQISRAKLERIRSDSPGNFPIEFCVRFDDRSYWDHQDGKEMIRRPRN